MAAYLEVLVAMLVAVTGLLAVLLVHARKAKAEAAHMDAETKALLMSIQRETKSTSQQVTNSHSTNLRDDMDDLKRLIGTAKQAIDKIADDLRDERRRITTIDQNAHDTHVDLYRRIHSIEENCKDTPK